MIERRNETVFAWTGYAGQDVAVQWYFRQDADLPVAVQAWAIPPGGREGMHTHHDDRPLEELYLVVSGRAEVIVADEVSRLGPGDAFLAKPGQAHDIVNIGDDPLTFVLVWGPAAPGIWEQSRMGRDPQGRATEPVW